MRRTLIHPCATQLRISPQREDFRDLCAANLAVASILVRSAGLEMRRPRAYQHVLLLHGVVLVAEAEAGVEIPGLGFIQAAASLRERTEFINAMMEAQAVLVKTLGPVSNRTWAIELFDDPLKGLFAAGLIKTGTFSLKD
jgi:hypothetical protein